MTITTLKQAPHLFSATLSLIHRSFHYSPDHRFEIDFAPLIDESNWHNCFIKTEREKVLAHVGVLEKSIAGIPVALIGGIAVEESRRGEGLFQELFQDVLAEKRSDVSSFILWSDQEKLYKKFGFHLCGSQFESPQLGRRSGFEATKLEQLTDDDFERLRELYEKSFAKSYFTIDRSEKDWSILAKVTSADIFVKRDGKKIESYFVMNKGQDLSGVIYEYGSVKGLKELMPELQAFGRVWSPTPPQGEAEAQYQFLFAPADTHFFTQLIKELTNGKVLVRDVNPLKQEVYFEFNDELLGLETEEFLRGTLGPGVFEELGSDIRPVFISGLTSI